MQVESLQAAVSDARQHLEDLQAGGRGSTQAQLDAAQAKLAEAKQGAEAAQDQYNQVGWYRRIQTCNGRAHCVLTSTFKCDNTQLGQGLPAAPCGGQRDVFSGPSIGCVVSALYTSSDMSYVDM